MSGLFDDMEEYKQRLLQMFVDFIQDKWTSTISSVRPLPVDYSFSACTDMDLK